MHRTAAGILVFCLGLLAVYAWHPDARAQETAPTTSESVEGEAGGKTVEQKIETYGRLRTAGMALTISGISLAVPGVVMVIVGAIGTAMSFVTFNWGHLSGWAALYASGVIIASVGSVALLTGVPCWIVGAVKKKRYEAMLASLRPVLGYDPHTRSWIAGVGFSF
jgi:hypothetical protein